MRSNVSHWFGYSLFTLLSKDPIFFYFRNYRRWDQTVFLGIRTLICLQHTIIKSPVCQSVLGGDPPKLDHSFICLQKPVRTSNNLTLPLHHWPLFADDIKNWWPYTRLHGLIDSCSAMPRRQHIGPTPVMAAITPQLPLERFKTLVCTVQLTQRDVVKQASSKFKKTNVYSASRYIAKSSFTSH